MQLKGYEWRVIRGLLIALVLASSVTSTAIASSDGGRGAEAPPTLAPGRDGELERTRRQRPFGPWGTTTLLVLAAAAAWTTRRAVGRGQSQRGRRLLAVTGVLIGCTAAELALRVTVDDWALHVKVRDGCYHDNPRGYFQEATYAEDPETTTWCAGPLTDVWAACDEETASKRQGVHRVMALGDSFTDGVGVFARDTWPAQLDAALGERASVVNCGKAASYTSHTAKRYLSRRERHAPQTVVYGFVLNDVQLEGAAPLDGTDIAFQLPNRQAYVEALDSDAIWGPLVEQSALGRLIAERLVTRQVHHETIALYRDTYAPGNDAALQEAMNLVGAMNELVTEREGRLLVVIWPLLEQLDAYPFASIHGRVIEELQRRDVAVLDLLPTFAGRDEAALQVHPTDHHPNEVAHGLAAEAVAKELRRLGVVP